MFNFCKKPVEPVEPVEPVKAIDRAEQELQDLKEMVGKPYDKSTFLFFLTLSNPLPDHFWKDFQNIKEDNWPDVWSEFENSIWNHISSTFRESFKMGIGYTSPTKKDILSKFIEAFTTLRNKQAAELLKKCKERYQEFYQKKEIDFMFSITSGSAVANMLKLKETYGQDVFWEKLCKEDYKPFDAKDWLEDGESL